MKRPVLVVSLLLPLVAVLFFGTYWLFGTTTESGVKRHFNGGSSLQGAQIELASYERGFFKSRAISSVSLVPSEKPIRFVNEIHHGPFAFTPDGMRIGSSHVVSTLDLESLPEKAHETVAELFGGKDPLVIATDISFGGGRTSSVTLASVDRDEDGTRVRFDGGSGKFTFSPDNSRIEGQFTIAPLSLDMREEEGKVRVRLDQATIRIDSSATSAAMEASSGTIGFTLDGETKVSFEIGSAQFRSDFSPISAGSELMLGSGKITVPSVKLSWSGKEDAEEKGALAMKDIVLEVGTSEANGLVTTSSDYSVGSLAVDSPAFGEPVPYLSLLEDGAQLTASATLPREILEELSAFQQSLAPVAGTGASPGMDPEQAREFARLLQSAIRQVKAGTGFQFQLRVGSDGAGTKAALGYTYRGDRALDAQKTYLEIVESSELRLEARIPKSLFGDNPELSEHLQGLLAMGVVEENGPNLSTLLSLEGGALSANGESLPLLDGVKPFLAQEIQWDAIFSGMEAAAGARAGAAESKDDPPVEREQ